MQWRGRRQSTNVEDQRGRFRSRGAAGIGGGGLLLILLLALFLGQDPVSLLQQIPSVEVPTETIGSGPVQESAVESEQREFVSVVLADTEDVWNGLFQREGRAYEEPALVLFRDAVDSGCGFARVVHPRQLRAARRVVPARPRWRRHRRLRHVPDPLATPPRGVARPTVSCSA